MILQTCSQLQGVRVYGFATSAISSVQRGERSDIM